MRFTLCNLVSKSEGGCPENIFLTKDLLYQGTAGIGIGSFLFHATLKHEAQLLDELPMIYTSA